MEQRAQRVSDDNHFMSSLAPADLGSLSGAAVLEPWRRRALGELPLGRGARSAPTASERHLWQALQGQQRGWLREYATGRYRLDFYLPSHRLAVEVDGSSHDGPVRKAADDQRDAWHRERLGVATLRVTVDEVLRDREGVLWLIEQRLASLEQWDVRQVEQHVLAGSGESPVAEGEVGAEPLALANERLEAEIQELMVRACVTVLPVFPARRPLARIFHWAR